MGFVGDFIGDIFGGGGGDDAAQASVQAAETQAAYQREALEYLKEREALPQEFREAALQQLAGVYGLPGAEGTQQQIIEQAMASPLYGALMGGQEAGEEAILRSAAATGGLRSGDVQSALYDYNTQLQNQALLSAYNEQIQGLGGMAGLSSMAPLIAQQTGDIGATLASGKVAAAQALQAGQEAGMGDLLGLGKLGVSAYESGALGAIGSGIGSALGWVGSLFSDRRLKKNIKHIGQEKGYNIYSWDWNVVAKKMGLDGSTVGVMADEIYTVMPDAVFLKDLFMMVDYTKIGILPGRV